MVRPGRQRDAVLGHVVALYTDECAVAANLDLKLVEAFVGALAIPFELLLELVDESILSRVVTCLAGSPGRQHRCDELAERADSDAADAY